MSIKAAPIEEIYRIFRANPRVTTDSRGVTPGSIFFALRGDSFNGNDFALRSLQSGAAFAVVDDPSLEKTPGCILVPDVLATLQELARHHRLQFSIPVIAVTGTNGKTTTKELISSVLSKKYRTLSTAGNLNNHIGVPLTILQMNRDTEIAIIEMGANHPGEIDFLCRIARPGFGIITNIGKAHLEGFGSFDGVVETKTELYRFLREHDGTVFLNKDDALLADKAAGMRKVTYGHPPADLSLQDYSASPLVTVEMIFRDRTVLRAASGLYGGYNTSNILAAACIGQQFGIPPDEIRAAIGAYEPVNNRSQIKRTSDNLLVLDSYNANPSSMKVALESFAAADYPRKVIILGDMLELGTETDREHLSVLEQVEQLGFHEVYLVGPVFTRLNTWRENVCFHDSDLARMWFGHHRIRDAAILLKGSRGIRLEKIIETL